MPRLPDSVVYSLGPQHGAEQVVRWVAGTEPAGPPLRSDRVLLDTFDGRLYRRDMVLWREGGSLRLEAPPAPAATATLPSAGTGVGPLRAADLPVGAVGERLREAIEQRALLARVRVRGRTLALEVCDSEGKTVARLRIEEAGLVRRGEPDAPLGRRLHVDAVLGYDRQLRRVCSALDRRLTRVGPTLADEALAAAGLPAAGVSSEVGVALCRDMRAGRATSLICRRLAEIVDANLPGVLADTDPEFLHDLRVAVRRSRSVLKEIKGVLAPTEAARSGSDLRWIQEITGPTRDLDVLLHDWPDMAGPVPDGMAGDLEPLVQLVRGHRAEAWAGMRRQFRGRRFAVAWAAWKELSASPRSSGPRSRRPIGDLAAGRIVAVYRSMVKMGSAIDDWSPPEAFHDLRKRGKELRYLLELFGGMWPAERVKPLVAAMKGLQDVLGHFQDDEIQVHELRRLAPALATVAGGTDSLIALGFVLEGLAERQRQAREDFALRFADFSSGRTAHAVARTFEGPSERS